MGKKEKALEEIRQEVNREIKEELDEEEDRNKMYDGKKERRKSVLVDRRGSIGAPADEKHPGYIPGAKTVARLRTPLFYTVKDACREALQEDRKWVEFSRRWRSQAQ